LTGGKQYAIQIDGTAIDDLAGNGFAGITDDTTWNFATTLPGDTTPPSIVTLDPVDDSSDVALATDLTVTFDENISSGTGTITLKNLTDVTQSVIDIDDAQVSISGGILTINPSSDLEFGKNYAVQISSGAIQDTAGNAFAGINDDTTWNFSTVLPSDTTPPSIVTLEPADDSVDVALGANLVVTFDEDIAVGSGSVTLKNLSDGTQDTIDINDAQITVSGTQLTINPALNLVLGKQYAVQIANTAIEDLSGNAFAGIADDSTWSFTTVLVQGSILDPDHPLVPAGVGPGETFQLVFVTSTKVQADDVDGTDDGTDNTTVTHWNNHVNSVAGLSTLQGISNLTWYAIVSVDDDASGPNVGVAAVDNAVVSAPVYRTDGTLIATGFADFWDSNLLAPIKWNENGVEQNTQGGSASGRQVWTGSTGTGAIDARPLGYPLSNTGNYSIRMGNADATGDDWINTSDATRRSPTSSGRVYALSEVITVAGAGGGVPTEDDNTVSASGFASTMVFDPSGGAGLNGMVSGSFAGFSGGSYTVEWSPDLVTPFAPVPGMSWPVEGAGTSGTGGDQIPWSHETGGATRAFYRLKIE
ncbi:MAG: Ig-like domain-containing protein, partial [Haloferula sp.]